MGAFQVRPRYQFLFTIDTNCRSGTWSGLVRRGNIDWDSVAPIAEKTMMGDTLDFCVDLGSLRLLEHSIYEVGAEVVMNQNEEEIEKTNIMV